MTGIRVNLDVTPVQGERDEAEIAAAVACVFAVLKARSVVQERSGPPRQSSWAFASRLEAVGQAEVREIPAQPSCQRSLWWSARSSLLSLLTAVSLSFLGAGQAQAADPAQFLPSSLPSYPVSELVPTRSGKVVRVLLSRASKTPDLGILDGASLINLANMQPVYQIIAGSRFQIRCEGSRLVFAGADPYCLAQVPSSGSIRQVVAMAPRVNPSLSGLRFNQPALNKFTLAFDVPDAACQPLKPSTKSDGPVESSAAAPKGGVKPIGYLVVSQTKDGLLSYNGRIYRGAIWFKPIRAAGEASFQAINLVDLEDYLLSVVPSEMPSSWAKEAVKAQSIAARSYAVANFWKNEKDNYDLKDTTDDQVYLGVESETAAGNLACDETAGIVLKHNQKVISAFFHSTSGGATEVGENVWGKEIPYVQSVVDYDDSSPHFSWLRRFPVDQAEKAFALKPGSLLSIQPFWKVASNRVKQAAVVSLDNTTIVTGERLRQLFKLPSSIFNVSFEDGSYIFAGRGFGHGLGMSQYGAKTLAESGYNAAQILSYYYRDVSVEYLNRAPGI